MNAPVKRPGLFALWFGVLGGPLAWAVQFQVLYAAVPGLCGGRFPALPWVVSLLTLGVCLLALGTAVRSRRTVGGPAITRGEGSEGRTRLMALGGLWASTFFTLVIAVQALPFVVLDPCAR